MNKLTIIIPCKNEEQYIGKCLESLLNQEDIKDVEIIIADANSTDSTINIINEYKKSLDIKVIEGGLPSIGRNKGAYLANSEYLLFIDADAEIYDNRIIKNSIQMMDKNNLHILGCKLNSHYLYVKVLYKLNNIITRLSKYENPFVVGIYFMIRSDIFKLNGGFPEDVLHCEDYLLSRKIDKNKFGIIKSYVYSDNRRFKKMGYFNMIGYIIKNIKNRNNLDYFKKDINYWL